MRVFAAVLLLGALCSAGASLETRLRKNARRGDAAAVRDLVRKGADVSSTDRVRLSGRGDARGAA